MRNVSTMEFEDLRLHVIEMRDDNYSYLIENIDKQEALVIDPSEAIPLLQYILSRKIRLTYIINTHHHSDHIDGNLLLKENFASKILASKYDNEKKRIPGGVDIVLNDSDTFVFGKHEFVVLDTPGHTLGHFSLFLKGANWLFPGDTLFSLGCGRLFEGNPSLMYESFQKYKKLPPETLVFCAHEYTLSNAKFIESLNLGLDGFQQFHKDLKQRKELEGKTIPSLLRDELRFNPYLLTGDEKLSHLGNDEVSIFAEVRARKDKF